MNPCETREYERFIQEMAKHCHCIKPYPCPCDGVLAGGLCDNMQPEPDDEFRTRTYDPEAEEEY